MKQNNVVTALNDSLNSIHIRTGDQFIFERDQKTDKIRIYQYNTRIFVGLVANNEFNNVLNGGLKWIS